MPRVRVFDDGDDHGPNLGLDHLVQHVRTDPQGFTVFPADAPLPDHMGLRSIPLVEPTPLYAWSPAWREASRHPLLDTLLRGFAEAGRTRRRLEYEPRRDWLPDTDHPKLVVDQGRSPMAADGAAGDSSGRPGPVRAGQSCGKAAAAPPGP